MDNNQQIINIQVGVGVVILENEYTEKREMNMLIPSDSGLYMLGKAFTMNDFSKLRNSIDNKDEYNMFIPSTSGLYMFGKAFTTNDFLKLRQDD